MKQGMLQIYTGKGKGKTTASLGLALRAAGADLKVCIVQFMKYGKTSEIKALKKFLPMIQVEQFGRPRRIKDPANEEDKALALEGLAFIKEVLSSESYDVIIMDEIMAVLKYELISLQELLEVVEARPDTVELILTGRNAPQELINKADLVTEMKPLKHYIDQGVMARKGIEK